MWKKIASLGLLALSFLGTLGCDKKIQKNLEAAISENAQTTQTLVNFLNEEGEKTSFKKGYDLEETAPLDGNKATLIYQFREDFPKEGDTLKKLIIQITNNGEIIESYVDEKADGSGEEFIDKSKEYGDGIAKTEYLTPKQRLEVNIRYGEVSKNVLEKVE